MGQARRLGESVLLIEDDRNIARVVAAILTSEGFVVHCLDRVEDQAVLDAVDRLNPDCLLLDSPPGADYGPSWDLARRLHERACPVPVIMFSAHSRAVAEATENRSGRSRAAHFAGVIPKPFDIEALLGTIAESIGQSAPA
jgi:DNA-binding response OmpR family regulator